MTSRNMLSNQNRPRTSELLELHVFYVPEEVWNFKLNTVSIEVISKFFSAGFIRVSPHMTLKILRENLGEYLGEEAVVDKYVFLKCIGEKLVVVKTKQEMELKLKSFAPPYAFHPELYLLPGIESIYSSLSSTPEKHHNNPEYVLTSASYERPHSLISPNPDIYQNSTMLDSSFKNNLSQTQEKAGFGEWNEKETIPVLHKKQSSEQPKNESIQGKSSSQQRKGKISCNINKTESVPSSKQHPAKKSAPVKMYQKKTFSPTPESHNIPGKDENYRKTVTSPKIDQNNEKEENNQFPLSPISQKPKEEVSLMLDTNMENGGNLTGVENGKCTTTADFGIPKSLEDRDMTYSPKKRSQQHAGITKTAADPGNVQNNQADGNNLNDSAYPSHYLSPPTPPLLAVSVNRAQLPHKGFPTEGHELHKQLKHIKIERRHLENTREELVKKVKNLIEQHKLRRCHVRDSWKKKYFEMKKVTVFSEEALNKLQENIELHRQKLLRQLEARDIKKKRNNLTQTTNSKNNLIIQITTLEREIDQLKRKLDNAKMKLVIEIKMKKQATSDLQALKAELVHKKVQSSLRFLSGKQLF
ncbi:spermatogenesis-associated protein 1 isoform X1 [Crotalus tigris]|uniref:spermatogenesis-associated protein 1 isoform X1 n=1 Tax=Crotalus tigris TaxID=88082 RepID=UPI00192F1B80|nr:spermatogenesis-associated protein 1 isoform X1 [Crotalus tigris]XP_039176933.1 spermatogenesis-associated protein 1 isoform X1 [Crotalus tigris]XP_039176935.1 spermatogenesis-associated protein 1 isoform X1 [Crotalus tigris]